MRQIAREIIDMAYDDKISDKQFREAIRRLNDSENRVRGLCNSLKFIREDAIVETERDMLIEGRIPRK